MRRLIQVLAPVLLIGLLAAGAYIYRDRLASWGSGTWSRLTGGARAETDQGPLIVSGVVEAESVDVAAAVPGRIRSLHASDGQQVRAGEPIAEIDASLLDAQIEAAVAAVQVAEAQLAQLRAKPREADLDVARAAVRQAQASAAASRTASQDARALVRAPAAIDVEIARAETELQVAAERINAATAAATAADLEQQLWGRIVQRLGEGADVELPPELGGGTRHFDAPPEKLAEARLQWNLKSQAAWEAHAGQAAATAVENTARQTLADLRNQKAQPVSLEGQALAAEAAVGMAEAGIVAAEANLRLLQAGATPEQIVVAEAAASGAEASLRVLEAKRPQYTVLAPRSGVLSEVVLHEGEVAAAGAPIARLDRTEDVTLTVYVPESRLGLVKIGGPVAVAVDAFPGRTFSGTVTHLAGEAEFTPKNVQTREERATTVFAVKIKMENAAGDLKAGMPVDAYFCPGNTSCSYPAGDASAGEGDRIGELLGRIVSHATAAPGEPATAATHSYAGSLEATEVHVASEVGGRALAVSAAEGDVVAAGQVMVTVEGEELAAKSVEAEAAVASAQAELARIKARPQAERVAQAEAGVKLAEAAVIAAEARLAAASARRDRPQELDSQINNARQQIASLAVAVDAARAQLKTAQVLQESLPGPGSDEDKTRRAVYDAQVAGATARVRAAEAQERGANSVLARLLAIRANPVELDAAVRRAGGELAVAKAGVEAAKAVAAQVEAAPQAEDVALAEARVAHAEAGRLAIAAAIEKLQVASPIDGQVISQGIHAGEVVSAAAPLFTVADLGRLRLVVYVPLPEIGRVRIGDQARVIADPFPDRSFTARVTWIADEAEYTPKNVQTSEERARMVIPVEVTLDNPEGLLRPGMGAEAQW